MKIQKLATFLLNFNMGLKNTMVNIANDSFVIMVHLNLDP
jgi:hypothetical protein